MQIAEVALFNSFGKLLTYSIPEELISVVSIGSLVNVVVKNDKKIGLVLRIQKLEVLPNYRIKPILSTIYDLSVTTPKLIELYQWISEYYLSPLSSVLETAIPKVIRKNIPMKLAVTLTLNENPIEIDSRKLPKQYEALVYLKEHNPIAKEEFLAHFSRNILDALCKKNIVIEQYHRVERQAYSQQIPTAKENDIVTLTPRQKQVAQTIVQSIENYPQFKTYLLHGVTGSGKTEVYIDLIRKVIAEGGSVLYLLPELTLTAQAIEKLRARFADIPILLWHSGLSDGERRDAWLGALEHPAALVIGARSAVFLPINHLRLIIVDEEHENAYKQEESPRYHGRDVAIYRAKLENAVCVLGSATPSLESYYNVQRGKFTLLELPNRIDQHVLPQIHIVDMRYERMPSIFSRLLKQKLADRLEKKEQAILFLNRRGFAPTVICKQCDYVAYCPYCSVPLNYHSVSNKLKCHFCNYETDFLSKCPKCGASAIIYHGVGIQRVEQDLAQVFPNARIARIDSDVLVKKYAFIEILKNFREQQIDILLGTQMIAKGLDFPNVTLVGLINADSALNQQDFRANERTFQLLVQVAGRAGRGTIPGEVVVQTHIPGNETLYFAKNTNYSEFFQKELNTRKTFNYPPCRHLIAFYVAARNNQLAELFIKQVAKMLRDKMDQFPKNTEIRGPATAPIEKIQEKYRYVLFIFTPNVSALLRIIRPTLESIVVPKEITFTQDVDAINLA